LLFLGLALSIFVWGLQYKLSLYEPPTAVVHQVPKAKLLSHDEHFRTTEAIRALVTRPVTRNAPRTSLFAFLALALIGFRLPGVLFRERSLDMPGHPSFAPISALFVRPPPSLG